MSVEATQILQTVVGGDRSDVTRLMELVYDDLRRLAGHYLRGERPGHTLQPTALVHEVYLKLINQSDVDWRGKSHFYAVGAKAMRQILVNHAKAKGRVKRGGGWRREVWDAPLVISPDSDEDVLALHETLHDLTEVSPRQAEIVEMRFFGGMTMQEIADALGTSKRSVEREWEAIRAWLRHELQRGERS